MNPETKLQELEQRIAALEEKTQGRLTEQAILEGIKEGLTRAISSYRTGAKSQA